MAGWLEDFRFADIGTDTKSIDVHDAFAFDTDIFDSLLDHGALPSCCIIIKGEHFIDAKIATIE